MPVYLSSFLCTETVTVFFKQLEKTPSLNIQFVGYGRGCCNSTFNCLSTHFEKPHMLSDLELITLLITFFTSSSVISLQ